jgi:hypothetical protein
VPEPALAGETLADKALECARAMAWVPGKTSEHYAQRLRRLNGLTQSVLAAAGRSVSSGRMSEEQRWLRENRDFLRSQMPALQESAGALSQTEHVRTSTKELAPRPLVIAEELLSALHYRYDDSSFSEYLRALQTVVVLRLNELWELVPALKLVLLERIAAVALRTSTAEAEEETAVGDCIRSLYELRQTPWTDLLEPLILFDQVLREDPAGAYAQMDAATRDRYRQEVVKLANYSDHSELEIAQMALSYARKSQRKPDRDARVALRHSHVGYYLLAEGREQLHRKADVRLPFRDHFQAFLRRHPDEFYPFGVETLTLVMILVILSWASFNSLWNALFAALVLLIPCSQSAVEIMNYLAMTLLDPQLLPKLDFSNGVPEDFTTMVVVPTLLINEKQVRQTVRDLEVRYVGNMSPNVHFALLTDLPDSAEQPHEDDPLVDLCGKLIRELNEKYAGKGAGTFAMFHRHRVYNRREGVWIGWERKRGKLLDFNKLILGEHDGFPYKVGDLSVLPGVRYVLTLDSDTQLPRGAAHQLIGTMAHPLCRAIIDSKRNVVTQGYGILQPRVGISVESTSQSRLASIYSEWTGLDIYTQAVSDVYQDLYGEGSFVGKGLYEVSIIHRVLDKRFPRNAILSHDLIEGAYTRVGLTTDIKVLDFYPSRYSAYARRKHRWVRGDWQIVEWLFPKVPDESGRRVKNPISLIARWKILDNLRRSMVEPATALAFVLAWTVLPGRPLYWTAALLAVLCASPVFQFVAGLIRAVIKRSLASVKQVFPSLATGLASVLLNLALLAHDALVCTDAIWRSLYRSIVSRQRLLQWETAAEAEAGVKKRTPVDIYLLCTPVIAFGIGVALYFGRRPAFWVALPILILWASSLLISLWLDSPRRVEKGPVSRKNELFLRRAALRTWRYFAEFSTAEHNWLIPDNVQQEPAQVAARVSPTNLGMLLNARQVACEMGYLTVPELVEQTRRTLQTMARLQLHRGHLLNWYDTRSLVPLQPRFVSSVDSGNLAASLIALNHGCRALRHKPLLSAVLLEGFDDHLRALADLKAFSWWRARPTIRARKNQTLLQRITTVISDPLMHDDASRTAGAWFAAQLQTRRQNLHSLLSDYMPWLLPEFAGLRASLAIPDSGIETPLSQLPEFLAGLEARLRDTAAIGDQQQIQRLRSLLADARGRCTTLLGDLDQIASDANAWFTNMGFSFLLDRRRKLLSIGYSVETEKLESSCYDLLASEARIAAFVAIAKGDIPQDVWLKLDRKHVGTDDGPTLISWAGTMFEYLMPALWMCSYPDSVLQTSMERAVKSQQAYAADKSVPWGISESGYSELNAEGVYGYRFFGIPELAMQSSEAERVVIAPYATALALTVDPEASLKNLRRMGNQGWFGEYGFYEAADFGPAESTYRKGRLVKSWMAHHQGMSLLSIANYLCDDVLRNWFHSDVYVEATELLLQERMAVRHAPKARRASPADPTTPNDSGDELVMAS